MSTYVLRFFPNRALAETSRALLYFSGASWKNEYPVWPQDKTNQPLGRIPVLVETKEDGSEFVLTDSVAMEKYIASRHDLATADDAEQLARQDELRHQIKDVLDLVYQYKFGPEPGRPVAFEKFAALAPATVKYHEAFLKANGSNGHYFGNQTTYLDIALFANIDVLRTISAEVMTGADEFFTEENAPEINKVLKTVAAEPAMAAYIATLQ
ncbi:hypothetical protein GGI12_005723 [Dipsacomyces acuminosporus]|nr:hypothetical protein GGI12_005723 [Dipsacomyces acuminosporus]